MKLRAKPPCIVPGGPRRCIGDPPLISEVKNVTQERTKIKKDKKRY